MSISLHAQTLCANYSNASFVCGETPADDPGYDAAVDRATEAKTALESYIELIEGSKCVAESDMEEARR